MNSRTSQPHYFPNEIQKAKLTLAGDWQRRQAKAKPVQKATINQAITLLRNAKKEHPDSFQSAVKKSAIELLPVTLPANWVSVLKITDGGNLNDECALFSASEVARASDELNTLIAQTYDNNPYDRPILSVGRGFDGDWFVLEEADGLTDDARVFRVSHEGFTIQTTWESIAMFLVDMLSGYYDD